MDLWNHCVEDWRDNYGLDTIRWKTTVGIGDSMYGLNIAFMRAMINQKPTNFQIHFFHNKEYVHHYEDPESVYQRFEFVRKRYMWNDMVKVDPVFHSTDTKLYKNFYQGIQRRSNSELYRYWSFDPTIEVDSIPNKIVLWRPTFNAAQQLNGYKLPMLDHEWQRMIDRLKDFGYDIYELCYRTPVSEAMYHIRTCECCISYEGMWHYVAKNFFKPHIVFSSSSITRWHTPAAVWIKDKDFFITKDLKKIEYNIESAVERAESYRYMFNKFVNGW
tara:strand:- start:761 stop:1582 length:822 start_codon:yes stop_codon:yes gene_type:complete